MSLKLKNILFPTDFSENSRKALPFVLQIALHTGSCVRLLYTVGETYEIAPVPERKKREMRVRALERLKELIEEIVRDRQYESLAIHPSVRTAHPAGSILEEAEECGAGLIVMGTKGASGFKKLLFGSVASETILESNIPVLLVPDQSRYWGFDHITFASDYHDRDLAALRFVAEWAEMFGSRITVLHVALHDNLESEIKFTGFREYVQKKINYQKFEYTLLVSRNIYTGLGDFLTDHTTQMIALVRYKKPFFRTLVEKDITRKMSFSTKVPLLILPAKPGRPTRRNQSEADRFNNDATLSQG